MSFTWNTPFHIATNTKLYEISLLSAQAKSKEVFIFEKWEMWDLFEKEKVEEIRKTFVENTIKVRQITNNSSLQRFTDNRDFVDQVMSFRYIPKDVFPIEKEVIIFDDTVAIYDSKEICIIENTGFAKMQKALFQNLWEQWNSPSLEFEYIPNHSFYNDIDYIYDTLQIIVWPDAEARNAYGNISKEELWDYLHSIISSDTYFDDATYIIVFIWSLEWDKMVDIWKFQENPVDNRSGPLSDVRVYKEEKICHDIWLASGNTLLVLGHEEKLRRQSKDLHSYLSGPRPNLPLEVMNRQDFFQ